MSIANLTHFEILARDHFKGLMIEASQVPIGSYDEGSTGPPAWFDENQFDLGREYFINNRLGMLNANLMGLIIVLSLPRPLALVRSTNQSNTAETARQRYVNTIIHTLKWYEVPLKNESKSWESLQRVRKYHNFASQYGQDQNLGFISQRDVSMTTFGFAGLQIIRPTLFGINSQNRRERQAFIHFWAVINHMIGVEDRFNMCLLPIEAVEIEFDLIMRNVFSPYLQIETLTLKQMVNAFIVGLQRYIPFLDYESQMFMVKRAIGIPGYQLDVDSRQEIPYRNILSPKDVAQIRKVVPKFSEKIVIYSVDQYKRSNADCQSQKKHIDPFHPNDLTDFDNADSATQKKLLGLPCYTQIKKKVLDRGNSYLNYLHSRKFDALGPRAQYLVKLQIEVTSLFTLPRSVALFNQLLDIILDEMRNVTGHRNLQFQLNPVYPKLYERGALNKFG